MKLCFCPSSCIEQNVFKPTKHKENRTNMIFYTDMHNNFSFTIQTHFDQKLIQKRQFWELIKKLKMIYVL